MFCKGQGYTGLKNGSRAAGSEELWGVVSVILHAPGYNSAAEMCSQASELGCSF